MRAALIIIAIIAAGGGFLGGSLLSEETMKLEIARRCAADGKFDLTMGGITWTYSCSGPKLDLRMWMGA